MHVRVWERERERGGKRPRERVSEREREREREREKKREMGTDGHRWEGATSAMYSAPATPKRNVQSPEWGVDGNTKDGPWTCDRGINEIHSQRMNVPPPL